MDPAGWSGEVEVVDVLQTIQQFSTSGVVVRRFVGSTWTAEERRDQKGKPTKGGLAGPRP
jgi:hypothetical protein